jgi:hypothetical protein
MDRAHPTRDTERVPPEWGLRRDGKGRREESTAPLSLRLREA